MASGMIHEASEGRRNQDHEWRRAAACNQTGNCVEINNVQQGATQVRDSKSPALVLDFDAKSWQQFLSALGHPDGL